MHWMFASPLRSALARNKGRIKSMAAPVVSGIAALIMSYYPDLTAAQVKRIILDSATRHPDLAVALPGGDGETVSFGELSITGGVVNAYEALRMAEQMSSTGSK